MSEDKLAERLPDELPNDPMHWADAWLSFATDREVQPHPNAMTLSTVGPDAVPSARVVLCKSFVADAGYVVFYTNYRSRKVDDIDGNRNVSLTFHWDGLGRQVRIDGIAVRSPATESDAYFSSRDRGSQIGAWGSDQSQPVASRDALLEQLEARAAELRLSEDPAATVPRPPHWGGIRVWAKAVELWIEGRDRVHDRALWTRRLTAQGDDAFAATRWVGTRLQP